MATNTTTTNKPSKINEKNIYLTFILVGAIAWFPLSSLMFNIFDLIERWIPNPKVFGIVQLSNLIAMIISILIILGLSRSKAIYHFTNEVFIELGKVSWPVKQGTGVSRWEKFREIRESTLVVLLSIFILGTAIALMDKIFELIVRIIF